MAALQQFSLPDVGEGLTEAEILQWHVRAGDVVTVNQVIVEIETAKAAVELPCPYAGVVTELLAEPGQTVAVGSPIITINTESDVEIRNDGGPLLPEEGRTSIPHTAPLLVGYGSQPTTTKRRPRNDKDSLLPERGRTSIPHTAPIPLAKPPIRKLAKELGIDLQAVRGSGPDGIITREDITHVQSASNHSSTFGERRIAVRGVRKATAQAMVQSAFTAPHVSVFLTVDVTPMMALRAQLKDQPEFRGIKLTPLVFAAKAVCLAVSRTPDVNAAWDTETGEIIYKDYVNLGIAVATPRGLVVPKIRNAGHMSLAQLATALGGLTNTAREGKTTPADMMHGTFSITNIGVFGIDAGTPIITPGESAILALGAIRDMPWVVDGHVVPRKVCQLALSFDHRVIDGEQGSRFLADVGALLSDPALAFIF